MPLRNAPEISRVAKTQLAIWKTIIAKAKTRVEDRQNETGRIYQKASVSTMKSAPCPLCQVRETRSKLLTPLQTAEHERQTCVERTRWDAEKLRRVSTQVRYDKNGQ